MQNREGKSVTKAPYIFYIDLTGRYGRLNYLNALGQIQLLSIPFLMSALLIIAALSATKVEAVIFLSGILLPFYLLSLRAMVLRLHDLNYSGWWSLVGLSLLIPGFGLLITGIWALILALLPGSIEANRYGLPAKRGGFTGIIIEVAVMVLMLYALLTLIGVDDLHLNTFRSITDLRHLF